MTSLSTTIVTTAGLRSRAAATFVQRTNRHICDIYISYQNTTVDAKSIMGILSLGLGRSSDVLITFDGVDDVQAKADLVTLIAGELRAL